ncbi:MAG: GGDEF domain-containing protein [Chromatiales bacterium]|nr:GGDEF domain-containing protein [Chromatiales bacterium]
MFPRQLERCARANLPVSLLFADVDHFKHFNDRHGHLNGDRALQHVASVLASCLRPTDLVARYGGEEFAALLPSAGLEQAELVAERLRQAVLGTPIVVDEGSNAGAKVTISLGVAQLQPGDSLADAHRCGRRRALPGQVRGAQLRARRKALNLRGTRPGVGRPSGFHGRRLANSPNHADMLWPRHRRHCDHVLKPNSLDAVG